MAKTRRLPTVLQLGLAEGRCRKLNEDIDCENVDFRSLIDNSLQWNENLGNLQSAHPELSWEKPEFAGPKSKEQSDLWEAEGLVEDYSYGVSKKSAIKRGKTAIKKAKKLRVDLKECREAPPKPRKKRKPRVCKEKTVFVPGYYRCPTK